MNDNLILISNARLSFPNLIEPQTQTNATTGKTRVSYNCDLIMIPTDPGFAAFMTLYAKMASEHPDWKANANQIMQMIHNDRKQRCYGQGNEKVNRTSLQVYDGYRDMVFISCGNRNRPQMIQADGTPLNADNTMAYQQLSRKLYAGCRVNVAIKPWLQNNEHGRGIRCDLIAVQFAKDDAPFGEALPDASGMFVATAPASPGPTASGMPAPPMPFPPFMTQ